MAGPIAGGGATSPDCKGAHWGTAAAVDRRPQEGGRDYRWDDAGPALECPGGGRVIDVEAWPGEARHRLDFLQHLLCYGS